MEFMYRAETLTINNDTEQATMTYERVEPSARSARQPKRTPSGAIPIEQVIHDTQEVTS